MTTFKPGARVRVVDHPGGRHPGVSTLGVLDPNDLDCFFDLRVPIGQQLTVSDVPVPWQGHAAPTHLSLNEETGEVDVKDGWLLLEFEENGQLVGYVLAHPDHLEQIL